ncbi:MAG: hypothetical protein WDW38_002234 [Sanguina aurantia]
MRGARAAVKKNARTKLYRIKVISMGDMSVGKSCLIKRFCEEKFISKYIPTIGVDYGVKPFKCGEYEVRVNLWDLAGSEAYVEVRSEFYREAQGCLLVYDVTSRSSFESLGRWLAESKAHGADNMVIAVAATKSDTPMRRVQEREGREWAASQGLAFFEVSACSGAGVKPLFTALFARMLATIPGIPEELTSLCVQQATMARQGEELE